ncbi:unnamed protein product [Clonostachys rhizophaga]|uniref:Zn(2)-C6 fungal-type domain-containing protein n=1 Tax=Clonostachys rhizophaga TaxID=160324 RepID=A0A9N9VTS2_9HYPO|nr:unnamed protein product [Clonostachys rhizophaga]
MPSPASGNAGNVKRPAVEGDDENDRSKGPIKTATAPSASGPKKLARGDRAQEDYSAKVKTRMSTYTRTGQACDRCKVRKIRCDALPDGCSSCASQAIKCFVTDRVSGRTERRGYLRDLERENDSMLAHIRELEQLIAEKGVEVWPFAATVQSETGPAPDGADQPITNPMKVSVPLEDGWDKLGSLWVKPSDSKDAPSKPLLVPNFPRSRLESRPEETWLGVGWDSRPLSSINGTTLTIMGTTIDTASFDAPDMDEPPSDSNLTTPLYNKSVQAFLQSASGLNPPVEISLPPREEAFTYTQYYFMFMASYIPILHKPTFMRLLERVYDEPDFKPTTAELVQVHMVFAIIFYQYGVRNWQEAEQSAHLNATSNKHYHFAISKFYELYASRDIAALQAMTLLAAHTRSFPKPGCGLLITNLAFQRAIDLEYHRNPKIPETGTNLGIELRKRIWWVLITIYVAVTGRRGRPMPITVEEFDTAFPEPLNDEQLTETGVDRTQSTPCNWQVGLATFKLIPIMMEMYSNIYSVRRDTQSYGTIVAALEKELDKWESELPADLRLDLEQAPQQHNLGALYLKGYCLEVRLSLRHTSTSPITDQETMAQNTKICEETARELLRTVKYVSELKSLDTTWTQMSIYTMAAFSLLVSYWTRRKETTPDEIATLRQEMEDWMGVLRELSQLMGSGPGILNQIGSIIERTIIWIENETARPPPPPVIKQESVHHGVQAPQHIQIQSAQSHNAPAVRLKSDQAPADVSIAHVQAHGPVDARPATAPTNAPAPQQVHHQHQQQQQQQQQQHQHSLQHRASPHQIAQQQQQQQQQVHPEGTGEKHYYHDHTQEMNGPPSYPITYANHSHHDGTLTAQPYDHETAMYYSATSQHAAPSSVVSVTPGAEANPLIAFASQAAQHVNTTEQLMWQRAGGNAWQDWTAAIADSDDRYGAGALLTLGNTAAVSGSGQRGSIASMSGAQHNPQDIAVQWPMVINTMVDHQNPHMHLQQQQQHHPHHTQHPHHQQHVHQ